MFTVKATYRGETRKLSFPYTTSFPTYDELCSQVRPDFIHLSAVERLMPFFPAALPCLPYQQQLLPCQIALLPQR